MRKRDTYLRFLCSLAVATCLAGCCKGVDLSMKRYSGFMSSAFDLSAAVDFKAFGSFKLQGSIGTWADLPALGNLDIDVEIGLDLDLEAADLRHGKVSADIDQDAYQETVRVLVAIDSEDPSRVRIFLAWQGDKYTLDEGSCYLAWAEGETIHLVSAQCGDSAGATLCTMQHGESGSFACEACRASTGKCSECSASGKANDCRPPGKEGGQVEASGKGDGGAATDASVDASLEAGLDAGLDAGTEVAVEAGLDASLDVGVAIELSTCEKQAIELKSKAGGCGMSVALDEKAVCESSSGEVTACYAAYKAADTFGQNICAVLKQNSVCPMLN